MATPTTTRKDPLPVFCFLVRFTNLPGNVEGFFKSVSGLKYETEVVPISAGGARTYLDHMTASMIAMPCSAPQRTNVKFAPCHSPHSAMVKVMAKKCWETR